MFARQSDLLRERRGPQRVSLRQRVWCTFHGKTMRCESEDISASGLRLSAPRYLAPGTRVEIKPDHTSSLVGRRRLCAQVVWARPENVEDACLGLEFCESSGFEGSWAASALQDAVRFGVPQTRRTRRLEHKIPVTVLDADRQQLGLGVTQDVSLGGVCVTTTARLEPGQSVVVQLLVPGRTLPLSLPCTAVSQDEDRLHLRFFRLGESQQRELSRFLCGRLGWWSKLVSKLIG